MSTGRSCWFCGRADHRDKKVDTDHGFTKEQMRDYDSLPWRGRDAYDHFRWYMTGIDHDRAFRMARDAYGVKA